MKTLIAYYSFTQNNEKLAMHLKAMLNCDIVRIETTRKRNSFSILLDLMFKRVPGIRPIARDLKDYDHVILVAPIWAGKIAMPMKSFIVSYRRNIARYSFVTLCGGSPGQKEKIGEELISIFRKPPMRLVELWVNDLLPPEQKNTIKHTSGFRIGENGFGPFQSELKELFASSVAAEV